MNTNDVGMPGRTANRREFLRWAGLGTGAALLPAMSETGRVAASAQSGDGREVSLTFWLPGGDARYCDDFETIGQNFEASQPDIDITETRCGTGEQDFNEVLLARIAAGNPPHAAVLWSSPVALGVRGALAELDALMLTSQHSRVENWTPGVLASCQFDGKTYGLPISGGTNSMGYNQELFEAKGIPSDRASFPKTWDEMRRLSKEFTRWEGDRLVSAGFVPSVITAQYELYVWSALNGGRIFEAENRRYTIDSDPNVEMMEFFVAWLDEEYQGDVEKVNASGTWLPWAPEGQVPAWPQGRMAMLQLGFWQLDPMYDYELAFERWNVAPFPIGPSGSETAAGYWPTWAAIPEGAGNLEEAFEYIDFIAVEGGKVWGPVYGEIPPNKLAPSGFVPVTVTERRGQEFAQEITDFYEAQRDIAVPMWDSPVQDFADDQLQRAIGRIMAKQARPKEGLAEAQQACQTELEKVL